MSQTFKLAVPSLQKVFNLGSLHSAMHTLPLFLRDAPDTQTFMLYRDGDFLEDRFEDEQNFEVKDFSTYPIGDDDWVRENKLSLEQLLVLAADIHGQEVSKSEISLL